MVSFVTDVYTFKTGRKTVINRVVLKHILNYF